MRTPADEIRLEVPRNRVEERASDRAAQLTRAGSSAKLVVIDQESDAFVVRRDGWLIPRRS